MHGYCKVHIRRDMDQKGIYGMCPECDKMVDYDEFGVTCDKCLTWYHIHCVGISDEQYKCMLSDGSRGRPQFHWYCQRCNDRVKEAVSKIDLLESKTRETAVKVENLIQRMDKVESKMSKDVVKNVRCEMDERADIDRRKLNVIVYNMPQHEVSGIDNEKTAWYSEKKIKADRDEFLRIAQKSLKIDISAADIKQIVRLGIRSDDRCRPLRITLADIGVKRNILSNAKKLNKTKDRKIFICPDLTPAQREKDLCLRKELQQRKNDGENNLYIHKGEIKKRNNTVTLNDTKAGPPSIYSDITSDNEIGPLLSIDSHSSSDSESDENKNEYDDNTEDKVLMEINKSLILTEISQINISQSIDGTNGTQQPEIPVDLDNDVLLETQIDTTQAINDVIEEKNETEEIHDEETAKDIDIAKDNHR